MKKNQTVGASDLSMSAQLLYQEAQKRKIDCRIFDEHTLLMKKGNYSWYTRGSRTSWQSSVGRSIADHKELAKLILKDSKIPTANFFIIKKDTPLELINQELKFPVAIKPNLGQQGKGVIPNISHLSEIEGYLNQYLFDDDNFVIAEEMMYGIEFRILCIDYHFFAATRRVPAFVVGDGQSSIVQLVNKKNEHPWRGEGHAQPLSKIVIDDLVKKNLSEQNLTLENILPDGEKVYLRKTANLSTGGEPIDFTDSVCLENRKLFEKIAKICDLNTIGIDVMCQDLTTPIVDQKDAGIIEVNASPGLRMHHFPLEGTPRDAAAEILNMVERKLK